MVFDYALVQSINEWSTIAPITVNWRVFSIYLGPAPNVANPIEGIKVLGNAPFMLFFFTTIGNLLFLWSLKGKET